MPAVLMCSKNVSTYLETPGWTYSRINIHEVLGRTQGLFLRPYQVNYQVNMIWWQTPWSLCKKRLNHWQVTVVFATMPTAVHLPDKLSESKGGKSKQLLITSNSGTNTSSQVFRPTYVIHWCELDQWLSAAAHVTYQPSTVSVRWCITDPLLSTAALFLRFCSHRIQTWATKVAWYLVRWILRSRMQYAIEISSNCNCQVPQGSVKSHVNWGREFLCRVCSKFSQECVSEKIL